MGSFLINVAFYLAGVLSSYVFYRLSLRKSLAFLLLVNDQPLARVNADVRARLKVEFFAPATPDQDAVNPPQPKAVGALHHLQFIIQNAGLRAIRFDEMPSILIPGTATLLDASIVYRGPETLQVSLEVNPASADGSQRVALRIPLLNKSEFCVLKLLLSEAIDPKSLVLHLSGEDLPRTINWKDLPSDATKPMKESIQWFPALTGCTMMICAGAIYYLAESIEKQQGPIRFSGMTLSQFFGQFTLLHAELALSVVGFFILAVLGLALTVGFGLGAFTRWRRIILPPELRPHT
jgi:hypothetical protein